ncbi:MAG: M23 family metallopeptidase [Erysipelotrichia bacterium]|nr:M23 family metallopeptidase [Erysipelotrichia bacterium]
MAISNYDKLIWCLPLRDGGVTKPFNSKTHIGVDFGWVDEAYTNIYPIQDGKVVDIFYSNSCGYSVVVQHDYDDGTHRWSAYIHLKNSALNYVKIGSAVKQAETVIGIRGNTGASNGIHLHIYVSDTTTKPYNWNLMKSLCTFDIMPYFYLTKKFTYSLAKADGYNLITRPFIEDVEIKYPQPVKRDENKHQVDIEHPNKWLRLRAAPNGSIYSEYCQNGIYDVLDSKYAGSYNWYKIAVIDNREFWVAFHTNWATDLPAYNPQETIAKLEKEVSELNSKIANAIKELN